MEQKPQDNKRRLILILIALLILAISGMLFWQVRKRQAAEANQAMTLAENLEFQHELDSLLFAHEQLKGQYGDLTMQLLFKDSLISMKADSIRMLIRRSADYNAIRKELNQLREESSMYMAHIDSLYRVTLILEAENKEIRSQYVAEQVRSQKLTVEKTELSQKVAVGSILKAYNIITTAYRTSSGTPKATDKARRTERLEVCFTIGENLVAETGKKDVFIRITRPDKQVLMRDASNTFVFNGETLNYSIRQNIRYVSREMSLCMHWDKLDDKTEAMPGKYDIVIIVDGYVIGQSQIELK